MAGDRLSGLSDQDGTSLCTNVVFEIYDFCQVTCRTWNPRPDSDGMPLLLNHVTRSASPATAAAVDEVLALGPSPHLGTSKPCPGRRRDTFTPAGALADTIAAPRSPPLRTGH